jgi:hypothetical protein
MFWIIQGQKRLNYFLFILVAENILKDLLYQDLDLALVLVKRALPNKKVKARRKITRSYRTTKTIQSSVLSGFVKSTKNLIVLLLKRAIIFLLQIE